MTECTCVIISGFSWPFCTCRPCIECVDEGCKVEFEILMGPQICEVVALNAVSQSYRKPEAGTEFHPGSQVICVKIFELNHLMVLSAQHPFILSASYAKTGLVDLLKLSKRRS